MSSERESRRLDVRLVPFAVTCWATTAVGILWGSRTAWCLVGGAFLAAVVLVSTGVRSGTSSWTPHRTATLALLLFGSVCSTAVAARVQAAEAHPMVDLASKGAWVTLVVEVADDPQELASFGRRVLVDTHLYEIRKATETIRASGTIVVLAPSDGWRGVLPGQKVVLRGQLSPPLHRNLTMATVRVSGPPTEVGPAPPHQRWAGTLRARFAAAAAVLPPDEAGLLPGLVVGDTSSLSTEVKDDFTTTGLTHLTAVSGANVSILLGAVLLLVRALGLGPRAGAVLAAAALVAFVVVARPSPSVLRAAVMGSVALLALVSGRRKQAVPALAAGVIALLMWSPALAVDFGFLLSVTATAALIVVAPVWVDILVGRGWPQAAAEMVGVAVAAFAVTAPIVAGMTGTVSAVSVGANLLVAPVIGIVTVLGAVTALVAAIAVPVAELTVRLTQWPLWWLVTVADHASRIPGASILVPSGPVGALLVLSAVLLGGVALRARGLRLMLLGVAVGLALLWAPVWPSSLADGA
ncbi:ComEC/Rec2 family competence protein [Rhodococcus tibetensis]|uniref:ComEC/Rec2 family competence protein n=1 Tax=Rhodococcus tibetensis TaxID=2965064 RepID=A0ABT1Q985_9NOCA|nr:ComEC/Rec2 family competence protein [Rhodococcus sp. FXJ9.536]MCQ4118814.1 ComEC/Rec2 family competence protein [Rhodococcus sp. FXJ9.536]